MKAEEMWEQFTQEKQLQDQKYQTWAFGADADALAKLVLSGEKTATASVYVLYEMEQEPVPTVGLYNVIENEAGEAQCIVQTTKLSVVPFSEVSAEHAYKEGEGDKSLSYWREVHKIFFTEELAQFGLSFCKDMKVLCEEFELVYC